MVCTFINIFPVTQPPPYNFVEIFEGPIEKVNRITVDHDPEGVFQMRIAI